MGSIATIFKDPPTSGMEGPILALAYTPGLHPYRCAIVYCTSNGACVSSSIELPDTFIMRQVGCQIERVCHVVWRDDHLIGVEYVNVRDLGGSASKSRRTRIESAR